MLLIQIYYSYGYAYIAETLRILYTLSIKHLKIKLSKYIFFKSKSVSSQSKGWLLWSLWSLQSIINHSIQESYPSCPSDPLVCPSSPLFYTFYSIEHPTKPTWSTWVNMLMLSVSNVPREYVEADSWSQVFKIEYHVNKHLKKLHMLVKG